MDITIRALDAFPEPEITSLRAAAFAGFGKESQLLTEVIADETERRSQARMSEPQFSHQLKIGAFFGDRIVGWSYSRGEDKTLHMINSGVLSEFRGQRIYSGLAKLTIAHAAQNGFIKIVTRHSPGNNAIIIPKLRLGFFVSAFEYTEEYGPLVHLTYLVSQKRRELYRTRSMPIVSTSNQD
jgi:ribosomal protein S18 acetylase RimI-like enzyme